MSILKRKSKLSGTKLKKVRDMTFYCMMMALPMIQFAIMFVGVNINSVLLSFKKYDADYNYTWTINNFVSVIKSFFGDSYLLESLKYSVLFFIITTVTTILPSLMIAFYLYKKFRFSEGIKTLLFIPAVVSSVVTITVFYYIADRGYPQLVEWLTGRTDAMGLLVNSETRLGTVLGYNIIYGLAGNWLFYASAMAGIDDGISEAARMDGASIWQEFCYITMPMIFPVFTTFMVSKLAGCLIGDYGMYAFAKASGGDAIIPTMGYYFTNGIVQDTTGVTYPHYAALGIVMSIMTAIIVFSARAWLRRYDPFEDDISKAEKKKQKGERKR